MEFTFTIKDNEIQVTDPNNEHSYIKADLHYIIENSWQGTLAEIVTVINVVCAIQRILNDVKEAE